MSETRRLSHQRVRTGAPPKAHATTRRLDEDLALAQHARRSDGVAPAAPAVLLAVQRTAGNAAAARLASRPHTTARPTVVQRCGPIPCDCPDSVREKKEQLLAGAPPVARSAEPQVQRWNPFKRLRGKTAAPAASTTAAPASTTADASPSPAEAERLLIEKTRCATMLLRMKYKAVKHKLKKRIPGVKSEACEGLATSLQECLKTPGTPTLEESLGQLYARIRLQPAQTWRLSMLSSAIQPFVKAGCVDQGKVLSESDMAVRVAQGLPAKEPEEEKKKDPMERIAEALERLAGLSGPEAEKAKDAVQTRARSNAVTSADRAKVAAVVKFAGACPLLDDLEKQTTADIPADLVAAARTIPKDKIAAYTMAANNPSATTPELPADLVAAATSIPADKLAWLVDDRDKSVTTDLDEETTSEMPGDLVSAAKGLPDLQQLLAGLG